MSNFLIIIALLLSLTSTYSFQWNITDLPSPNITILSSSKWCMFLPPKPGQTIPNSELDAIPFCSFNCSADTNSTALFPLDFLLTAHFLQTETHVQVLGRFNSTAYKLHKSDEGGQFDSSGSPPGAQCVDANGEIYEEGFINLVEPAEGTYCVRCCKNGDGGCSPWQSTLGCQVLISGNYNITNVTEENFTDDDTRPTSRNQTATATQVGEVATVTPWGATTTVNSKSDGNVCVKSDMRNTIVTMVALYIVLRVLI